MLFPTFLLRNLCNLNAKASIRQRCHSNSFHQCQRRKINVFSLAFEKWPDLDVRLYQQFIDQTRSNHRLNMCSSKMYFLRINIRANEKKRQFVAITIITKSPKIPPTNEYIPIPYSLTQREREKKVDFRFGIRKKLYIYERQVFYCLFSHISV